jgi:putative endonuclease
MVYHVYILASATGVLYVGVTNNLERRIAQHKEKRLPGFTKRYSVTRLVYYEAYGDVRNAIAREKEIKAWRREKKLALIRSMNPSFRDLSLDFHR